MPTRQLPRTVLAIVVVVGWLLACLPTGARAQVGHPPGASPYHDIRRGHTFTPLGGYFSGDGGRFGIAPHSGGIYGFRYDIRAATPIEMGLGFARGSLDRLIVDPFVELANRVSGPVKQTVTFAEFDLQLNLTGGKTWHHLAPFLGAGVGLTFPSGTAADTSGFKLGHKFYFAPSAGVRIFLTDRLHLRGEARTIFWKLKYPTSFTEEPPLEPGTTDNPNAVITDDNVSEWTTSSWLQVGLGYTFSP